MSSLQGPNEFAVTWDHHKRHQHRQATERRSMRGLHWLVVMSPPSIRKGSMSNPPVAAASTAHPPASGSLFQS